MEDAGAKLGHIGQNQDEIDVGGAVVQGEQDQLIGFARFSPFSEASGVWFFTWHLLLLLKHTGLIRVGAHTQLALELFPFFSL